MGRRGGRANFAARCGLPELFSPLERAANYPKSRPAGAALPLAGAAFGWLHEPDGLS